MHLILIYMTRPTARITGAREGIHTYRGMRRNYKFMAPRVRARARARTLHDAYARIWESEEERRAFRVSAFRFAFPSPLSVAYMCARTVIPFPVSVVSLRHPFFFWSGKYENEFDDARRAAKRPGPLFEAAFSDRRKRINISADG